MGDGDDDGADADGVADWNLRKCSAAALDNLSGTFGADHVLPTLLPALEVCTCCAQARFDAFGSGGIYGGPPKGGGGVQ